MMRMFPRTSLVVVFCSVMGKALLLCSCVCSVVRSFSQTFPIE